MVLNADQYWRHYLAGLRPADRPTEPVVTVGCAGDAEITDELARLYVSGSKTAGSSLLADFLTAGDAVPRVGDFWILLGKDGVPRCILRTTSVETYRFDDVPERIAVAEGEGDLSIAGWKRTHRKSYAPRLAEWGIGDLGDAVVITQHFEVVSRETSR